MKKSITTLLFSMLIGAVVNAAVIDPSLREALDRLEPGETIQALACLSEQADIPTLNQQLKQEHATLAERNRRVILALQEVATRTQPELVSFLEDLEGRNLLKSYKMLWVANMFAVEASREGIEAVAARTDIEGVYLDYHIENIAPITKVQENPIISGHEIGLDRINAPAVWAMGWTGAGRVLMNIDTGVEGTHPALSARFRGDVDGDGDVAESWFDPYDTHYPTPIDDGGHGTHTMGTICGRSASGDTVGVAINAQWIAAAAIDRGGGIPRTVADAILSFQWAVDPDGNPNTQDNPDAIGNSWGVTTGHGYPPCDQTFWTVIDNCEAAGSAVIFSAGNEGSSGLRRPADRGTTPYNCFAVGAVDGSNPNLPIASFSSLGPTYCGPGGSMVIKPEVVAPGVNVRSSYPGGGYTTLSGTSMASPHVTGSVAILRQVNPNLDVDAIKEILMATATDLPFSNPNGEDNTYGHGNINLLEAVQVAMTGFGSVEGIVRNASNNDPIPATISVVGGFSQVNANGLGYYIMALPADTSYTLRASYFGFVPQDQNVAIVADDTVTQNFMLSPAPTAILQGHVRDTTGAAISGAIVTILNTPLTPETTDGDGSYQFPAVPSGSTYQVTATASSFSVDQDSIYIQSGTNVLDFILYPVESFEYSNGQYVGSGVWEWGTPSGDSPNPHSGTKCWGTVLAGNYPDNADDPLYSREFQITDPNASLEFYHWYETEPYWDGGNVSISTDDGSSWTLITPTTGYPEDLCYALNEAGFSASSGGWQLVQFDIGSYMGQNVKFKFRFASDVTLVGLGWYIDDVAVSGAGTPQPPDIAVNPASIQDTLAPNGIATHNLTISNNGPGFLIYSVATNTNNLLLLDDMKILTVSIAPIADNAFTVFDRPESEPKPLSDGGPINPPQTQGQGGPDLFGYRWIDSDELGGPTYSWVDISGFGTPISGMGDDTNLGPYPIGFNFSFYGMTYNTFRFCTNGFISFTSSSNEYDNTPIPSDLAPLDLVAGLWDDLYFPGGGSAYYYSNNVDSLVVSYVGVPHYSSGGPYTFQIILTGGSIYYQYQTINTPDNSATVGIQNTDGMDGLQVVFNASYLHNNLAIKLSGSWLSASPTSGNVAPGGQTQIAVTLDANGLSSGVHTGNVLILSNDPDSPTVTVPVTLLVTGSSVPDIDSRPTSISDTLSQGNQSVFNVIIKNLGGEDLIANLTATEFNMSLGGDDAFPAKSDGVIIASMDSKISPDEIQNVWLFVVPAADTIAPAESLIAQVTLNSGAISPGTYTGRIRIECNDPDESQVDIPVSLLVTGQTAPDINPSVTSFADTVDVGGIRVRSLMIGNTGNAVLYYGLHDNRAWITVVPDTGNVPISQTDTVAVTFNASALAPGSYSGQVNLNSNDPDEALIILPVSLVVRDTSGGGCTYMPGDINFNSDANGVDVTYGVNYFKGFGPPPPVLCADCPDPGESLFGAGDVNANCEFNGVDITYFVNYLKGVGPALSFCASCPPSSMPAMIKGDDANNLK